MENNTNNYMTKDYFQEENLPTSFVQNNAAFSCIITCRLYFVENITLKST